MNLTLAPYDLASEDASALSELIRREDIWDGIRVDGKTPDEVANIDWTGSWLAILREEKNGITHGPIGFQIFIPRFIGVYEMHVGFAEGARGVETHAAIAMAAHRMFIETDAAEIFIQCPEWRPALGRFALHLGADSLFRQENFAVRDGKTFGAGIYSKRLQNWIFDNFDRFWVEQCAKEGANKVEVNMRSATVELAKFQPVKAQGFYNVYAGLSGQPGVIVVPFPSGAVVLFHDLRIFIIEGKVATSEEIQCQ